MHSSFDNLIENFFLRVTVLPWNSEAAQEYGRLRAGLEREGQPLGNLDVMIAAHALALDATLVTFDRRMTQAARAFGIPVAGAWGLPFRARMRHAAQNRFSGAAP